MMLLAEIQASHWFLALLMMAACAILFRSQRKAQATTSAGRSSRTSPSPAMSGAAQRTASVSAADKAQWETEMHDFARDVSARIDSKLAALEHLLRAAHHETLRLETAIAQAGELASGEGTPPMSSAVEFKASSSQAHRLVEETQRQGHSMNSSAALETGAADRPYARIYALADAESSARDIAAQVGCPVGEVELILSLRKQK